MRELDKVNDGATDENFKQMLRAVKFSLDTRLKALRFKLKPDKKNDEVWDVCGYCDSDYAGDKETRLSVSGFCVFVMGCLVSWKLRGQKNVTLSSREAECYGIVKGASVGLGLSRVLTDFGVETKVVIHTDSSAAKSLASRKGLGKARHIKVNQLWIKDKVGSGVL